MAAHGKLEEFNSKHEDWESYEERLQQYFVANGVEDAGKRRAILLSACGQHTYQVVRNLVAPKKPAECEFTEITEHLTRYFSPKSSIIVQRFKFNSRCRQQGESIAKFVAELRHIAQYCGYAGTLEDMLRDRLVCGVNDSRIQRRLLSEPELTFKKAYEHAQAMELADKDTKDLAAASGMGQHPVHSVQKGAQQKTCYRCKGQHNPNSCHFKDSVCHNCGKKGHIQKACRTLKTTPPNPVSPQTKSNRTSKPQHSLNTGTSSPATESAYTLFNIHNQDHPPIHVNLHINNREVTMELDTGAAVSVISEQTYKTVLLQQPPLQVSELLLRTYTGERLTVLGKVNVRVRYGEQIVDLPVIVVSGSGPNLMGRDWLQHIKLKWAQLCAVSMPTPLQEMLDRHQAVFRDELGELKGTQASIVVDSSVQPRFYKPRTLPFALKAKVESELDRLQNEGVITPVQFSSWAAPVVPIVKSDGNIRLCGDYKLTVNQAARVDKYPLPKAEDLFASLAGGTKFSKLDLAHAYQQVRLDESTKPLTTINTHRGLFVYNRLPFGVSTAPAIFQRIVDSLLQGIPNVVAYLDDILITGSSDEQHLQNLESVLTKLDKAGLRLKMSKCSFMSESVEYLGHCIDAQGLHPTQAKVDAVKNAPVPTDVIKLKFFLGLINYYRKFLPDLSSVLAPLNKLLQKGHRWNWTSTQQTAFEQSKNLLQSSSLLAHYDPTKQLILACDASPYGIGAVLSQLHDGQERPVAFASRSLSTAEKNYSQLEREGLAVVFGVKRFHQYLYGRHFLIYSDHQPLRRLFSETKAVPPMASGRIQRWALTLSSYEYELKYKPGKDQGNCDALSRLPLPDCPETVLIPGDILLLTEQLSTSPVTAKEIKVMTEKDPILSRVLYFVLHGWPHTRVEEELKPYYVRRTELSHFDGCLLWGSRVIVPPQAQETVLKILHEAHPGSTRMKQLARGYVWWPHLNTQLENTVSCCEKCQVVQSTPAKAPLHPWQWPERPWSRIHIDYAGPFLNKMFLVIIDAHSKWMEVLPVSNATTAVTVEKLLSVFSIHGLPHTIVSDNGSVFTSSEFAEFVKQNGVEHILTSPYHPASNGLAERSVQTFKNGLKRITDGPLETRLNQFLFKYRITPQTTTGLSPAEMLFGRRLRSHLDLLMPTVARRVCANQQQQKVNHDGKRKLREFVVGNAVYVKNFSGTPAWVPGVIEKSRGPLSYLVKLLNGKLVRRHVDHVKSRLSNTDVVDCDDFDDFLITGNQQGSPVVEQSEQSSNTEEPVTVELRRSTRVRQPPKRWSPDDTSP